MNDLRLWDTWLDKFACSGIVVILITIGVMFYSYQPEATAVEVAVLAKADNPSAKTETGRLPEIQAALDKCKAFWEAKDYVRTIEAAQQVIKKDPKESFAYLYLARAFLAKGDMPKSITNYSLAVQLNPDFVDKKSPDKIGPELKGLVRNAVIESEKEEFSKIPEHKKTLKALYYLQRRLAGGCE